MLHDFWHVAIYWSYVCCVGSSLMTICYYSVQRLFNGKITPLIMVRVDMWMRCWGWLLFICSGVCGVANMYAGVAYADSPECPDNLEAGRQSVARSTLSKKPKNVVSHWCVIHMFHSNDVRWCNWLWCNCESYMSLGGWRRWHSKLFFYGRFAVSGVCVSCAWVSLVCVCVG